MRLITIIIIPLIFCVSESKAFQVVINEFMKEPPSGVPEYIELFNTSDFAINLKDWKIGDSRALKTITKDSVWLEAGSFIVIAKDSLSFVESFSASIRFIEIRTLPALNNNRDQIRLFNEVGILSDSLEYFSSWGGKRVSLERRDIDADISIYKENWGDSPSINLGTPGKINSIETDQEAPKIQAVDFVSSSAIRILYDERVNEDLAIDLQNYEISPSVTVSSLSLTVNEVMFFLSEPLIGGQVYRISIQTQEDIFGNIAAATTESATYIQVSTVERDSVIINEFLYKREDGASPEFIELYNSSSKNYELSDWEIVDRSGNHATLIEELILLAESYVVFTDQKDFANSLTNAFYLPNFPSLNDSGDEIILKDNFGLTIDSLFYKSTWGGSQPGASVERKDPKRASNDPDNWTTSTSVSGSSAGFQNPVFENDIIPPSIRFAKINKDYSQLEVTFNEFIRLDNHTAFKVFDSPARIANFDESAANQILLEIDYDESAKKEIRVSNLFDTRGNSTDHHLSLVAFPLTPNALLFNEIMFDPIADDDDNLPDQTEYVEIYNSSDRTISLEGISLSDAPNEDGEFNSIFPLNTQMRSLNAGQHLLIYAENEAETYSESRLSEFFEERLSEEEVMRVDRSSLSLSATGDAIFLRDSTGVVIDSVFYSENWHNPNRFNTDGIALEKISSIGSSNDASNWSSSVEITGGTPGRQNSIFQNHQNTVPENGLELTPNPFSPSDQDGFEDNLFINYRLNGTDYAVSISIFDRYGREVRRLADGVFLPQSGTLIWDGFRDDGTINRVGRYIILFEARNNTTGKTATFKRTVVIARR